MRLGTSGLGVIAVVSLLVAAAPERDASGGNNRESGIDPSRTSESERTSRTRYSTSSQVATETTGSSSSRGGSFVKTEFESRDSTSPKASGHLPHSSLVPALHHVDRQAEIPTALGRFTTESHRTDRALVEPRNFKNAAIPPDVRWASSSPEATLEDNGSLGVTSSVPVDGFASSDFHEKLVVTLDSPLAASVAGEPTVPPSHSPRRRGERGANEQSRRSETGDNYGDKESTSSRQEPRKANSSGSSIVDSAGTMNHRLTTTTTTTTTMRRRLPDENFGKPTERYELKTVRGTRESSRNKETTEASKGQAHFRNSQVDPNESLRSSGRTMSGEANDALRPESRYLTNYSVHVSPTAEFELQNDDSSEGVQRSREEPGAKRLTADRTNAKPVNRLPDEFVLVGKKLRRVEPVVNDDAVVEQQGLTAKSIVEVLARKPETLGYSGVTEEIARPRQITSESSLENPTIKRPLFRASGANTSDTDVDALSDNHKSTRTRSFQTVNTEQQRQQQTSSFELPSRLPFEIAGKDEDDAITGTKIGSPVVPVNHHLTIPKSAYPVAKNLSKPSTNLVDGKPKKKYYEIKPSLITEMDHGANLEVTTSPRRTFDKFLLPSVPSALGKYGPYFLDEEDRRNVTERIGSTVLLNCRIGMLGQRKVTWLQHYKDSFRLLTVERESYSVDRRISLNFQYPDNWRLQIAYASIRDSGLYKCQVEINQDKSLVKRYNVIITAPILSITDDSGRTVSGERHLKAGSALKLRCEARDVMQRLNESVLWMRGDETLAEDVSENRTTEIVNEKEITVVVSTLLVERATPRHAGNYSCVVPEKAKTTIAVHVLNGELPAAVQHGSGVSTAVLNLWLIHLTASYGFFR